MNVSLYIDSSEHLILGLLDKDLNWIEFLDTEERKGSGILHGLLHELMQNHSLEFADLKNIFFAAGPGSYTGMRLGEGICQVLEMDGVKINSFYHFEVPQKLGIEKGVWVSKAFKKEVFVYKWDKLEVESGLVAEDKITGLFMNWSEEGRQIFTHFKGAFDDNLPLTSDMIYDNSDKVFEEVFKNPERKRPYYYRSDEKEFKVTQPDK